MHVCVYISVYIYFEKETGRLIGPKLHMSLVECLCVTLVCCISSPVEWNSLHVSSTTDISPLTFHINCENKLYLFALDEQNQ